MYSSNKDIVDNQNQWVKRGKKWKARYMGALGSLYGKEPVTDDKQHKQFSVKGSSTQGRPGADRSSDLVNKK